MKRDFVDFFLIPEAQLAMHERLCNWARYVQVRRHGWPMAPMWRQSRSNARQWHQPEIREPVNQLDGHALEKAVGQLPAPHRDAIRWHYVHQTSPARARRILGVTNEGLCRLVIDARRMLMNRSA